MTPVNKPAAPATPPAPPATDPAPAAKVEVKADAKAAAPAVVATPSPDAPPVFDFKDPGSYSVKLDFNYGGRNMGNEQGIDHSGLNFRFGAGPRFRFLDDRLTLAPRLFYDYQGLNKDLGAGVESNAAVHSFGIQTDLGYAIHPSWFSVHGLLDLGAAHYTAEESRDGMKGAEFNKNALLFPLSNTSFMFGLGAQLCTWGDAVCAGAAYRMDPGLNPTIDVVDGNYPAMGLSPNGFTAGGSIDIMRIVDNIRGGGVSKPRSATRAADAEKPVDAAKPATVPVTPEVAPVAPAKPALTGLALVESLRDENKAYSESAKKNADTAKLDRDEVKKAPAQGNVYAVDSVNSYRSAQTAMNKANENVAKIKGEIEKLSGDDKKKAEAALKDATAAAVDANKQARAAWDLASESVKLFNKNRGTTVEVDFPDLKPDAQGAAPRPSGAPTKPAPKKDPPKKDPPKQDPPKQDPPKQDPPKKDPPKQDPPKGGGGADW